MVWAFGVGRARRIAEEAANWRAEMEEPQSEAQVATFEAWLRADPAHLRAYNEASEIAEVGERLPRAPLVSAPPAAGTRRFNPAFALAAAAILAVGTSWLVQDPSPAFAAISNHGPATRVVSLRDGSIVTLDTGTSMEVALDPVVHHVRMSSGRARFAVRLPQDRPLEVTTEAGKVTAANCVFDVAVIDRDLRVWLISGDAEVAVSNTGGPIVRMHFRRGQAVRLRDGVASAIPSVPDVTSWPQAHIGFDDTPLAKILTIANRSGLPRISVSDGVIGGLPVTGVLDLRDNRKLARKLAVALDLIVVEKEGTLLLRR